MVVYITLQTHQYRIVRHGKSVTKLVKVNPLKLQRTWEKKHQTFNICFKFPAFLAQGLKFFVRAILSFLKYNIMWPNIFYHTEKKIYRPFYESIIPIATQLGDTSLWWAKIFLCYLVVRIWRHFFFHCRSRFQETTGSQLKLPRAWIFLSDTYSYILINSYL